MATIFEGFIEAFYLLASFNKEIYSIIGLSIFVSLSATIISSVVGILFGTLIGLTDFRFKKTIVKFVYSFMALPPVVVGLFVMLIISRRGPLGGYQLMFTPLAMISAQTILITPIITGIIYNQTKEYGNEIREVSLVLGGNKIDQMILVVSELKRTIAIAITTGFGRGISEVGAVMIVGGNIKGHTRVMTTFIAMNNSMGNYSESIAMGMVLIGIAILTNTIILRISGDVNENSVKSSK